MAIGALYIHVPFCHAKCVYCDFDSRACADGRTFDLYVERMLDRLESFRSSGALALCSTAYIGGGTPTVLGRRLCEIVARVRDIAPGLVELTCEANPESLSYDLAAGLAAAGATRISLGVQSFQDNELRALGRLHDARRARGAIGEALRAGLDVSADLMCAIPLQTDESWNDTLLQAFDSGIGHVSVYPLTIEEGTPLAASVEHGVWDEPDEDVQAVRMERARACAERAGMHPYEVASYALPGKECLHNIAYWTGVEYLGLGRSAASMLARSTYEELRELLGQPACSPRAARLRFVQTADDPKASARACAYDVEELDAREAAAEDLMLGMRMTRGVDADLLTVCRERIGARALDRAIEVAVVRGLARWSEEPTRDGALRLVPTHDGWLLGNELYGLLWELAHDGA